MQSSEMYHSLLQSVTAGQLLRWRLVTSTIILVTMDLTYDETNKTETEENKFWTLTGRKHPLSALFQSAGEYAWNARDDSTFCGRIYRHGCASNLQQKLYFIRKWWQNSKKKKQQKKNLQLQMIFHAFIHQKRQQTWASYAASEPTISNEGSSRHDPRQLPDDCCAMWPMTSPVKYSLLQFWSILVFWIGWFFT